MGTYHPLPDAVVAGEIGRKLEDNGTTYQSYIAQLQPGESLWLGMDNGSWNLVILLDTEQEYDYVSARREGKGPSAFYAIPDMPR